MDSTLEIFLAVGLPLMAFFLMGVGFLYKVGRDNKLDITRRLDRLEQDLQEVQSSTRGLVATFTAFIAFFNKGKPASEQFTDVHMLKMQPTTQFNSPPTLTEKGVRLSAELDAAELVDRYLERVKAIIPSGADSITIQEICLHYARFTLLTVVTPDEYEKIWDKIDLEQGNAANILDIYGILFRDTIFRQRGIDVPMPRETQKASAV